MSIASLSPIEFAYVHTKEPGYTATAMGEVINLIKCQPVEVKIRNVLTQCYNELPITYLDKPAYMTPKNHLFQYIGTEVTCSGISAPSYFINNL